MQRRMWHGPGWLTLLLGLLGLFGLLGLLGLLGQGVALRAWGAPAPGGATDGHAPDERPSSRPSPEGTAPLPVVFLAPMDRERESRELAQAVTSQLSDLKVRLVLFWAAPASDTLDAWLKEARRAGENARALAVFWTSQRRLHLVFGERGETQLLIRDLGEIEGSERAEALALILRTALSAYQRGARFPSPPGAPSPARAFPEKTPSGQVKPRPKEVFVTDKDDCSASTPYMEHLAITVKRRLTF